MEKQTCLYCDPYPTSHSHWIEKIGIFFSAPIERFIVSPVKQLLKHFPIVDSFFNKIIFSSLFKALLKIGILQEVDVSCDNEQIHNRTLVVIHEARQRNITIKALKFLGKHGNLFSIVIQEEKRFFEGLPGWTIDQSIEFNFDNKEVLRKVLQENKLPCPEGRSFKNHKRAIQYAGIIGFPIVVKPPYASLSKHTICNITSEDELKGAVRAVKIISPEFIVEKFIEGDVFRITVVDNNFVACCLREPPNIIGDGIHSVEELIEIKNSNPQRGKLHQKNFTLHKIPITETTVALLAKQGLNLHSVLPEGKKIYLHNKVVLACGADIHDTTDAVHPDNKVLFQKVGKLCKAPIVGIDFICKDISKSYHEQQCAIIEANSLPYIDMHHYPVTGAPRDVASCVLDYVLLSSPSKLI